MGGLAASSSLLDGPSKQSVSDLSVVALLIKPFIGAGILALPHAFNSGGLLASSFLMAALAIMTLYCIYCLLDTVTEVTQRGWRPQANIMVYHEQSEDEEIQAQQPLIRAGHGHGHGPAGQPNSQAYGHSHSHSHSHGQGHPAAAADHAAAATASSPPHSPHRTPSAFRIPSNPSMRDIGYLAFGNIGRAITDFGLIASQIGFCIAYSAFISENMNSLIDSVSRSLWILLLFISWAVFCQIRQPSYLAFTSTAGNLVYFFSLAVIFYDGFHSHWDSDTGSNFSYVTPSGLPFVFGTASFALEGIGLILPVKRAVSDPKRFPLLLNISVGFVSFLYIFFGSICVFFYGDAVKANLTQNLASGFLSSSVKASLSASLFFSFVIQMFPVLEISDHLVNNWFQRHQDADSRRARQTAMDAGANGMERDAPSIALDPQSESLHIQHQPAIGNGNNGTFLDSSSVASDSSDITPPPNTFLHRILPASLSPLFFLQCIGRVLCVSFPVFVAWIFPNFGLIVDLVGCVANSSIAFILPGLFYVKLILLPRHEAAIQKRVTEASNQAAMSSSDHMASSSSRSDSSIHHSTVLEQLRVIFTHREFFLPMLVVIAGIGASVTGLFYTIKSAVEGDE